VRRAYLQAAHARAEYAEQTREEEARRRVAEERMRIARELHDVVAHHLALANAQAGTAAHIARTHPEQARRILAELTNSTSSALRELKATVGLLRQAGDSDAPLEPAPRLAQLPGMAASLESAGLTVTVVTDGEPRWLSPGVDLTAFRIVQEALTNVTKHAAAKEARVRLAYSRDRLTITVTDEGDGATSAATGPNGGFGLIGMRERALSVGGRLRTGRRPEGGFQVTRRTAAATPDPGRRPRLMTISVLLADDQALLRDTFRILIDSSADLEVVAEAGDGGQAIELARAHRPDVVVMDIRMPGTDGLTATAAILRRRGTVRHQGADPDHLRDRRVRRAGPARRRERLPRQGRQRRGSARRHPHRGLRRRTALPAGPPAP